MDRMDVRSAVARVRNPRLRCWGPSAVSMRSGSHAEPRETAFAFNRMDAAQPQRGVLRQPRASPESARGAALGHPPPGTPALKGLHNPSLPASSWTGMAEAPAPHASAPSTPKALCLLAQGWPRHEANPGYPSRHNPNRTAVVAHPLDVALPSANWWAGNDP